MSEQNPGRPLLHAIARDAAAMGITLLDLSVDTRDWASATFVGHRHRLGMTVEAGRYGAWLARLAETEWSLPGHVVVDVAIVSIVRGRVTLAALTVLDR